MTELDRSWRKHHHLPAHVYEQPGVFFITICTRHKSCSLATINRGMANLSALGEIVKAKWAALPQFHPAVILDRFVAMPNHVHALLSTLPARIDRGSQGTPPADSVLRIISAFKASATREVRKLNLIGSESMWQRDHWDHVVRHQTALDNIRMYIEMNPQTWDSDRENDSRRSTNEFYRWIEAYQRSLQLEKKKD